MSEAFRHLHIRPELACDFLATFARMEYALKAAGYANGDENRVEAAWDRFANDIDPALCALAERDASLKESVSYLLGNPPRKQVLRGGTLEFIDQRIDRNQTKTQQALLMIRTTRNNLFHGGKFLREREAGRDERLIQSSLAVLLRCIPLQDGVLRNYEG